MSKIRTLSILQDSLDNGLAWRVKEIANLKISVRGSPSLSARTVVRAGVPLLYAHWEGFVKQASQDYLSYVTSQRLTYGELASCFVVFGTKKHLSTITSSRQASVNIEVVNFFRKCNTDRADLVLSNAIDTQSNLNSDVFQNIALSLGVPVNPYSSYFNLIDESLLARRNKIAHGEYLDLNEEDFRNLSNEVIKLLRNYKTDIENLASLGAYKINVAPPQFDNQ
ncbi:MAE_28990/MAE_18760 family HEPN-like nuclease [Pseudomonas extremaustralis]|uniref:MAE_28990/MAE_18760 family HEPN-like nuclease n=1 Tax=Pseudomonas extremaustralis TaxID=359110 RepID=UPI0023DE8A06|nr:MAE_28990/MAE_18760 family HEPN-like nuclease [Pseudomonas extremaustralis]MDF3135315.1 MAE_28990/MAE_18760 family HEPN-like nuclease [Pseudomonas extremaustralis]